MPKFDLPEKITELSQSKTWDSAKREWILENIFQETSPETCLCGHFPILELCVIRNKLNNCKTIIGNCCVKKVFSEFSSDKILQSIKRIKKDINKPLNAEAIEYAYERKWINDFEYNFSMNTTRKRVLSSKQESIRYKINKKILSLFDNQKK